MNPLTEARHALATRLGGSGYRVYAVPVEAPSPPCILIGHGTPWIVGRKLSGRSAAANLLIRVVVPGVGGNLESMQLLEEMVWEIGKAVMVFGETAPAATDKINDIEVLTADLMVHVQVKE